MKINYFQDTDTLYIEPHPAEVSETKDLDENTILDLDAGGNICSMTIEHATSRADIPHFSCVPSSSAPLSLQVKPGLEKYMIRLLATLFFCSLLSTNVAAASPKPGDIAPEFKLQDLSGKQHTLADLRAKGPVLLFFWSTECGFCRVIAPKLQKLYLERAASGLTVAGIDIDFKMREQVEAFVRERNLTFLILHGSLDNADAVEAYGVPGTPTLVVVGRDGRVVYYGHSLDDAARRIP